MSDERKAEITWRSSWRDEADLTIVDKHSGDSHTVVLSAEELFDLATNVLTVVRNMRNEDDFKFAPTERSTGTK